MAKISEATVYVDEVDGNRLKLTEKHSRKNPQTQEWTTTGYTDVTAWLPNDYDGPELTKGMRIKVSASQRTEKRVHNGTTYKNLTWNLNTVEVVQGQAETHEPRRAQSPDPRGDFDPNEPF